MIYAKEIIMLQNVKYFIYFFISILSPLCFANTSNKAIFSADNILYDLKANIVTLSDNAKITQGKTSLTGKKIIIYKDAKGNIKQLIDLGDPATYTKMGQRQSTKAYADRIEYYPNSHKAILIGNGSITQNNHTFKGPYIIYDTLKQTITTKPSKTKQQSQIIIESGNNE